MDTLKAKGFLACCLCGLLLTGCGKTVQYEGRTYSVAALSEQTLEWLEWYNALSDEDKLKIDYIPADLLPDDRAEAVETGP